MRAKDIMTTPVVSVSPGTRIKDVARLMFERRISAVPVIDDSGDLMGILSEGDLVELETLEDPRAHARPGAGRPDLPVPRIAAEIMTSAVVALPEDADVAQVARLMLERKIKSIPIVSGNRVTGIVSRRDLLRVLARSDQEIETELNQLLEEEIPVLGPFRGSVRDGVVTLSGPDDLPSRRLAGLLARGVPGVVDVAFDNDG